MTIIFRPVSATCTDCSAQLVGYARNVFERPTEKVKPKVLGPFPANSPLMTRYLQDKLASAEKHMTSSHPEYRSN